MACRGDGTVTVDDVDDDEDVSDDVSAGCWTNKADDVADDEDDRVDDSNDDDDDVSERNSGMSIGLVAHKHFSRTCFGSAILRSSLHLCPQCVSYP